MICHIFTQILLWRLVFLYHYLLKKRQIKHLFIDKHNYICKVFNKLWSATNKIVSFWAIPWCYLCPSSFFMIFRGLAICRTIFIIPPKIWTLRFYLLFVLFFDNWFCCGNAKRTFFMLLIYHSVLDLYIIINLACTNINSVQ